MNQTKRSHIPWIIAGLCVLAYLAQSPEPKPEPEVIYTPGPPPVYAEPEPEPEPAQYELIARVVKLSPYRDTGAECDVEVTNTSDKHIKIMTLQMTYTGMGGEYLGVCEVAVRNLPPNGTGIGTGTIREHTPEQLGNYTLRVDAVVGSDNLLMTEEFMLAENMNQ